ncbi:MAG TPA: Hsp70 family protein [Myxococcales bacterium]|nr:Hsp70 family protein [Myxococcales bacterium]
MRLGIDFGTTHTVVAAVDRGNYPIVSFEHADFVPSIAAARADGTLRFGAQATAVLNDPEWTVLRSFKRLLNEAGPATEVAIGPRTLRLIDVLAGFLAHVREELHLRSNAHLRKGEPLQIAASVPANASNAQRMLTVDGFRRAGFDVAALVNEPSAAGFEYAHRFRETVTSKREYVLVYDLGGGTFDASLIKMEGRTNEVVTSAGIARLGGDDFDEAILRLVESKIGAIASLRDRQHLLEECRIQKESVNPNTRKFVVDLAVIGRREPFVISMDEVYAACAPLVDQTLDAVEPVMRDPRRASEGVDWNEVAGMYVVGGASAFPPVYRQLRERFGAHRVRRSPHPFGSTAIGLAITLDERAGYKLAERFTRHFGVFREESAGTEVSFDVLLPKDTRLPSPGEAPLTVTRTYRAAHNLGHYRFVECARIEDGRPEGNLALWDEVLFPFDPGLRGVRNLDSVPVLRLGESGPHVEETVRCDAAGELEIQLRVLEDGFSNTVRIARRGAAKR